MTDYLIDTCQMCETNARCLRAGAPAVRLRMEASGPRAAVAPASALARPGVLANDCTGGGMTSQEREHREWRRLGDAAIKTLMTVVFLIWFVWITGKFLEFVYQPYP
ncbi:MAG: hypothetical protein K0S99_566 [Thermomicrobiales bacterium]|jgi:hypothetical protein|nr:hypothetical protein [Thermomicrobiales bacterium]